MTTAAAIGNPVGFAAPGCGTMLAGAKRGVMVAPHAAPAAAEVALADRAATRRLGARLAKVVRTGDVIALAGALGTGKTTLARDLIETLAGGACEVPSPTFTLVQTYELETVTVWHFDLYRIERPEEVIELGLDDALAEGVTLIEWPDRMGPLLPDERLDVMLVQGAAPDARIAQLEAHGVWRGRLAGIADDG